MASRDEVLVVAGELISGDRHDDYGSAVENFSRIAQLWSPILGVPVSAVQVALCMSQVKVSRLVNSPGHVDSWVDAVGYFALGGEIATD